MVAAVTFGERAFSLHNLVVALCTFDATGFDTPVEYAGGQKLTIELDIDHAELREYGKVAALADIPTGGQFTLSAGALDISTLAVMSGFTSSISGSAPNRRRRLVVTAGDDGLPYFGLIGVQYDDKGGLTAYGFTCGKLSSLPSYTMDGDGNKFNVSEMKGSLMETELASANYLAVIKSYESAANWTVPTTGGDFKNFFTTDGG